MYNLPRGTAKGYFDNGDSEQARFEKRKAMNAQRTIEIRSAVLLVHGEKAHSCYFSRDTFESMTKNSSYADNKELLLIPGAVHTDLYDKTDMIPFEKIEGFFRKYLDS